jgi:prevent-host-death family protein
VFVSDQDPNRKGNVAEAAIVLEAARLGIPVLRPMTEHGRYDMVFELGERLLRVQCKWASVRGDVIVVTTSGSRLTPRGYVRSTYGVDEIDAIAAYCDDLDRCYLLPAELISGQDQIHLRLAPPKNNQRACLNWASEYALQGAVAQLGERRRGTAEATGSSPVSSILSGSIALGAHEYRQKFGWYMERAAAGESFLITRRGKPYARLAPANQQLEIAAEPAASSPAEVVPITTANAKERTA